MKGMVFKQFTLGNSAELALVKVKGSRLPAAVGSIPSNDNRISSKTTTEN